MLPRLNDSAGQRRYALHIQAQMMTIRPLPSPAPLPMKPAFPTFPRALLLAAMLTLSACASTPPPLSELSTAQQSIARAVSANADQYADTDLSRARNLMTQAQSAMAGGQHDQARQLAGRAAASADLAHARSRHAAALASLTQRRSEITELQHRLQQEPLP